MQFKVDSFDWNNPMQISQWNPHYLGNFTRLVLYVWKTTYYRILSKMWAPSKKNPTLWTWMKGARLSPTLIFLTMVSTLFQTATFCDYGSKWCLMSGTFTNKNWNPIIMWSTMCQNLLTFIHPGMCPSG